MEDLIRSKWVIRRLTQSDSTEDNDDDDDGDDGDKAATKSGELTVYGLMQYAEDIQISIKQIEIQKIRLTSTEPKCPLTVTSGTQFLEEKTNFNERSIQAHFYGEAKANKDNHTNRFSVQIIANDMLFYSNITKNIY